MSPQRQKFAELIATGEPLTRAYAQAFGKPKITDSVRSAAARLAKDPDIHAKVNQLRTRAREESEAAAILTIQEKRQYLAQIVRTPVTEIDKEAHKNLIKKRKTISIGSGENAETITEYEGYDKLAAMKLDTELAGDAPTDPGTAALTQLLTAAMSAPHPVKDQM